MQRTLQAALQETLPTSGLPFAALNQNKQYDCEHDTGNGAN